MLHLNKDAQSGLPNGGPTPPESVGAPGADRDASLGADTPDAARGAVSDRDGAGAAERAAPVGAVPRLADVAAAAAAAAAARDGEQRAGGAAQKHVTLCVDPASDDCGATNDDDSLCVPSALGPSPRASVGDAGSLGWHSAAAATVVGGAGVGGAGGGGARRRLYRIQTMQRERLEDLLSSQGPEGLQAALERILEDRDPRLARVRGKIQKAASVFGGVDALALRLYNLLTGGEKSQAQQDPASLAEFRKRIGDAYGLKWQMLSSAIDHTCRWVFLVGYVIAVLTTALTLTQGKQVY